MLTSYEVVEQGLSLVYSTLLSVCGLAVIRLQSCGHEDAVRDPLPKWIITLLCAIDYCFSSPCLSSPYPSSFCCCRRRYAVPFVICLLYFHPWKCGLLSSYTFVFVVSILGTKGTTPLMLRLFSRHNNSGSFGAICLIFLGGGWPDDVRFPRRSGDSPPLVAVS